MEIVKQEPLTMPEYSVNSFSHVRMFVEILYKCKLCTSLPSILTSEECFLNHMNNTHFQESNALKKCQNCQLKFRTKEDVWAHKKQMHSDFASDCEQSSDDNDQFEIAWQVTTEHKELNGMNSQKRKKSRKEKHNKSLKKAKNDEDMEQDPHIVISHGAEHTVSPATPENSANLLKLTNQITSDASPSGNSSHTSSNLTPSSTPEFGKFTKLIREGGNIIYFCQVCNWKSQMKVMFSEHCSSSSHLVKLTIAEQNDSAGKSEIVDGNESSLVQKYGKKGHFMSFLDEKINYYINKRLSNESMNNEEATQENCSNSNEESQEVTNDSCTSDDNQLVTEIKQEPKVNLNEHNKSRVDTVEHDTNSNNHGCSNDLKRKLTDKLNNKDFSDDSDSRQNLTPCKVTRQYIEISNQSDKMDDDDSQFQIQSSNSQFSPFRLMINSLEKEKSELLKKDKSQSPKESSPVDRDQSPSESDPIDVNTSKSELSKKVVDDDNIKKEAESSKTSGTAADYIAKAVETEFYKSNVFMYRCSLCSFACNDITEYRVHFETEHEPEQAEPSQDTSYSDCKTEQWKSQRLREILPEILVAHPRGNVSRDLLLQKISAMTSEPEINSWGPACNKALRELFPDSLAQRKGKFKKTYFFGVALIDQIQQEQESSQNAPEKTDVDFSPLRDMTQDMDRILQHLHNIVRWRGDMEAGVSRDDVLHILGRKIEDQEVQHWGVQCNRAIRILFPHVQMKRKGKYKTTVYFGVTFSNMVTKEDFASLTAPKQKTPKPPVKDDGIRPKISWRDAIRTVGGKAFSDHCLEKRTGITRGWGPMLNPVGPANLDGKESSPTPSMYIQSTPSHTVIPPNVTAKDILSCSLFQGSDSASANSPQNMSLLRYHLTSDEFDMYYKYGSDLMKSVWKNRDELIASRDNKEQAETVDPNEVKKEISENSCDEKSNDADDENSQSTVGDEGSSPVFTPTFGNPNIIHTQEGVMYIKQEVDSDQES